jgi:hypothetical protein
VVREEAAPEVQVLVVLVLLVEPQTLVVAEEVEEQDHLEMELVVPVVPVSSFSVIRSVSSQSKQLVEQFLILVVRLFIPLHHQRPLPSLILL